MSLTNNAIENIFNANNISELPFQPIVQIIKIKPFAQRNDKLRVAISDGKYFLSNVIFSGTCADEYQKGNFQINSLVKLMKYVIGFKDSVKYYLAVEIEIIAQNQQFGMTLGAPQDITALFGRARESSGNGSTAAALSNAPTASAAVGSAASNRLAETSRLGPPQNIPPKPQFTQPPAASATAHKGLLIKGESVEVIKCEMCSMVFKIIKSKVMTEGPLLDVLAKQLHDDCTKVFPKFASKCEILDDPFFKDILLDRIKAIDSDVLCRKIKLCSVMEDVASDLAKKYKTTCEDVLKDVFESIDNQDEIIKVLYDECLMIHSSSSECRNILRKFVPMWKSFTSSINTNKLCGVDDMKFFRDSYVVPRSRSRF